MLKIGVGPSSSHTLGPWRAAQRFVQTLANDKKLADVNSIRVLLYGSLAKTGIGHGTDIAVQLGLAGEDPVIFPVDQIPETISAIKENKKILLNGTNEVSFDPITAIEFRITESLPFHPNALSFIADFNNGENITETYFSVGGGFVIKEGETELISHQVQLPFPVNTADDLLHWVRKTGMAIYEIVLENETAWRSEAEINEGVLNIWRVMKECIYRGCHSKGTLPGGLFVKGVQRNSIKNY